MQSADTFSRARIGLADRCRVGIHEDAIVILQNRIGNGNNHVPYPFSLAKIAGVADLVEQIGRK